MSIMPKLIAFYLPQYHPIPENNDWWGNGFTEWTNVSTARPLFDGHSQPHIPADLGFYDLRLEATRIAQAELARQYGIGGFCYYHYWFNGKMLLDQPLNEVLVTGKPDFPFCLCWANENWTRAWDGLDREVLIKQEYTAEDSRNHFNWLSRIFQDPRYIKVEGRPVLLVYRIDHIPSTSEYFQEWRTWAQESGFPDLFLCAVKNGFVQEDDPDILNMGFDAIIDFQPNRNDFPSPKTTTQYGYQIARRFLPNRIYQWLKRNVSAQNIVDYRAMINGILAKKWPLEYLKFPCVFPSWDNTARRKTPTIIQNDDPALFGIWLKNALSNVKHYPAESRFVFVNAWNEWAEGCHLEPDKTHGHAFLKVVETVLSSVDRNVEEPDLDE